MVVQEEIKHLRTKLKTLRNENKELKTQLIYLIDRLEIEMIKKSDLRKQVDTRLNA